MTVIAHHLIWTAYGWWLPNDPRGSMSQSIREDLIAQLGALHHGRKKVQPASRDIREFYSHAAEVLKHDLLVFTESERSVLARVFDEVIR